MGKIANRQSLAFSERNQLSQAIPQFHVERMLNEWMPITRFESQHNERMVCENQFLYFGGRYDRQRTLAIRIAAITLASDSARTIMRFRPSKNTGFTRTICEKFANFFEDPLTRVRNPTEIVQKNLFRWPYVVFKKALLQNLREMIRERICNEMIRVSAQKSELEGKSRSYKPKVRVTVIQPGRPPESEPNHPEDFLDMSSWSSYLCSASSSEATCDRVKRRQKRSIQTLTAMGWGT